MCMDSNGHPGSFLHAHLDCVSKSCDDKSCCEEAGVVFFLLNRVPRYEIGDTMQRVTFMYILVSIFQFCSFPKV